MTVRVGLLAACLLLIGCGSGASTPSPAPPVVKIAESGFGPIIVDGAGLSLYSNWDPVRDSTCVDQCAQTWPPLIVTGDFAVGDGLDRADFSTVTRPDGSLQLKFHDYPLYHFYQDVQPGDAKGNGALAIWYMIRADGRVVFDDTPPATP